MKLHEMNNNGYVRYISARLILSKIIPHTKVFEVGQHYDQHNSGI